MVKGFKLIMCQVVTCQSDHSDHMARSALNSVWIDFLSVTRDPQLVKLPLLMRFDVAGSVGRVVTC